ncbi:hypothetical protein PF008_g18630 [Phytophthora fragariae]|uniref:Bzip transcription factor n=2 Tax=Phytophthora fragariae TaxID=53985 RepID=A0A6G0R4S0_9STRA|nr:hypothetical protein PF008_g18630 [Phytophthora fragariae]
MIAVPHDYASCLKSRPKIASTATRLVTTHCAIHSLRFEIPSYRFHRFDQTQARISDEVPTRYMYKQQFESQQRVVSMKRSHDAYTASYPPISRHSKMVLPSRRRTTETSSTDDEAQLKRQRTKSEIRREQCRTNQARYRNKQRNNELGLDSAVDQLRQELDSLEQRRLDIVLSEKTRHSPWAIMFVVFRMVENAFRSPWSMASENEMHDDTEMRKNLTFLHEVFTADVAACELTGIAALVKQWRHYSMYLGNARLQLQQVESVAPGVMTATAKISVVTTELIMRHLFSHLVEVEPQSKYDPLPPSLRDRLLGQLLHCSISVDFYFDEENGRVVRLEPKIDLMPELFRILGDLEDVAEVLSAPSDTVSSDRLRLSW